jgi:hypothetical protein
MFTDYEGLNHMQLNHFCKTALQIGSSFMAALIIFAVLAGQSANAASVDESNDVLREYSRTLSLVTHLEQNLLEAQVQIDEIHSGYERGIYSTEELFTATIILFDIESAVSDARQNLAINVAKMKAENPDFNQYDMQLASRNF